MKKVKAQFYTVPETAKILRFSPLTIYKWIKKGKIKAAKFGNRSYRISRKELANFFQSL